MLDDKNVWKVKNIEYENRTYRLFNEFNTDQDFAVVLENVYRIHGLVETFGFKIYYLKGSPKTNLIINLKKNYIADSSIPDVQKIRDLQESDLYYLYLNLYFEVLYFFPHINENNNYSYNLLILVKKDFDIEKISKYNFNLINIIDCVEIQKSEINFDFINNLFENRSIIKETLKSLEESEFYTDRFNFTKEEYIKKYNNGNENFEWECYRNTKSMEHHLNFDQNKSAKAAFRDLCTHILDFGREFYIELNKYGMTYNYDDIYDSTGLFFTNFGELADTKVIINNGENIKIEDEEHTPSCLADCYMGSDIHSMDYSKEFVLYNKIDFKNKEVRIIDKPGFSAKKRLW